MDAEVMVELQYRLSNAKSWVTQPIALTEYFDLEPNEAPSIDSLARFNHACDYVRISPKKLEATRIILSTTKPVMRRTILETFWCEGRCRLIERVDSGPDPYRELIICSEVQADPNRLEIIRLIDLTGQMTVAFHVIIETQPDGTEQIIRLFRKSENQS